MCNLFRESSGEATQVYRMRLSIVLDNSRCTICDKRIALSRRQLRLKAYISVERPTLRLISCAKD